MADYGFKIAKEGFDVNTAADTDLEFSSSFPITKVFTQGEVNTTVAGESDKLFTILSHSQNVTPFFIVIYSTDNTNFFATRTGSRAADVEVGIDSDGSQVDAYINNLDSGSSSQTVYFKYFIYIEGF